MARRGQLQCCMDLEDGNEVTLEEQAQYLVRLLQEPLSLDRWGIQLIVDDSIDARACCTSNPEYSEAEIRFDFSRVKTGDDLAELVVHEMTHPHVEPLGAVAIGLADLVADSAPEHLREGLRKMLLEEVRKAEERVTTDIGHVFLKLLRRAKVLETPSAV